MQFVWHSVKPRCWSPFVTHLIQPCASRAFSGHKFPKPLSCVLFGYFSQYFSWHYLCIYKSTTTIMQVVKSSLSQFRLLKTIIWTPSPFCPKTCSWCQMIPQIESSNQSNLYKAWYPTDALEAITEFPCRKRESFSRRNVLHYLVTAVLCPVGAVLAIECRV